MFSHNCCWSLLRWGKICICELEQRGSWVGLVSLPGYGVCLDMAVWLLCSRDAVCQMKNYSSQEQRDSPELLQAPKNLKPNLACPPWAG